MAARSRQAGFGLIELMIAMVLGLIVMGAAFAVFQSNIGTFQANEGLNRMQESARVTFEMLSRDMRAAGGSACSTASVVETTGAQSDLFRNTPVTGSGTELTVTSGDDTAYTVLGSSATSVTLDTTEFPGGSAANAFSADDWLLLCNARKTFVVQANTVSANQITFDALPGNYNPSGDEFAPPAAVVIARFRSNRWYTRANGRPGGGNSLYVQRNGVEEEVVEGVSNLAFTYREDGAAGYTAAPANWANVVAVRMDMVLQGEDVDGNALTRNASSVASVRSRSL